MNMKLIALFSIILWTYNGFADEPTCSDVLQTGGYARSLTAMQMAIPRIIYQRYRNDPFLHNLAYDLLNSSGELKTYQIPFNITIGAKTYRTSRGNLHMEIYHIRIDDLAIGSQSGRMSRRLGALMMALNIATDRAFSQGIPSLEFEFSAILNADLYDLLKKNLKWNNSYREWNSAAGKHIQFKVDNFLSD